MTAWLKPSHKVAVSQDPLPENYRHGISLTLNELLQVRSSPIIHWLSPQSLVKTSRVGGFRSRFKGRGMDFDESRVYQIGDDIRNIDWRVTARTGEAHTKLFKEERERPVFVLLDQMPSMFFATQQAFKSVVASKIAAQLMWNALSNGDRFGALLFGHSHHLEMKPSSNRRNCMRLLNRICESHQSVIDAIFSPGQIEKSEPKELSASTEQTNPLTQALRRLKYLAKPGSLIQLVSDFNRFDQECQRHLSNLSQHTDIHCILVKDPIEENLPPAGSYGISDGVHTSLLNTARTELRNRYHQAFEQKLLMIKNFSLSHQGIFTQVDTNFQQSSSGLGLAGQKSASTKGRSQ